MTKVTKDQFLEAVRQDLLENIDDAIDTGNQYGTGAKLDKHVESLKHVRINVESAPTVRSLFDAVPTWIIGPDFVSIAMHNLVADWDESDTVALLETERRLDH